MLLNWFNEFIHFCPCLQKKEIAGMMNSTAAFGKKQ
jgi:hypothetical protein